ncbi:tetratricopeptide repeat protein [bacterium]|nr:tetratricopeptide repeat protein [bacterium]
MNKMPLLIWIFLLIYICFLPAQDNVSVLRSGERLLISAKGQFGLGTDILEEDAALLVLAKARDASVQHAIQYLMRNSSIIPSLKKDREGVALALALMSIAEETPDKIYSKGQQQLSIKFVMELNLNLLSQRLNQVQKQPWLFRSYQMEHERFESLYRRLIKIESQNNTSGFQEIQAIVKALKASEWVRKGLLSENTAAQVQQFDQAVILDPDYAFARFQRGKAYSLMQAYEKAVDDYNVLIEKYPDWTEVYHARGLVYGYLEKYDQVIEDYQRVLGKDPNCISALINQGIAYSKTNQLEAARADYQKVLEIHPEHVVANYNLGCIYALQGDQSAALKSIESAFRNGYSDYDAVMTDEDLKSLHANPEFKTMIEEYKKSSLK